MVSTGMDGRQGSTPGAADPLPQAGTDKCRL